MNKATTIGLSLLTLWGIAKTHAQQVLKRITDDTSTTTVELFVLRNGNTPSNVVGEGWFDIGTSSSWWTVNFKSVDGSITYNSTANINWSFPILPNEPIWNGNFQSSQAANSTRINFTNTVNSSDILDVSVQRTDSNADAVEDTNANTDLLKSKFLLSKSPNIPVGTRAILRSRTGKDLATWSSMPEAKRFWLQFNGITWTEQSVDRNWWIFSGYNSQTVLWTEDFESISKSSMKAYPNPTTNNITLDNWDQLDNDFDFEIYDITGRKVW